MKKRFFAGLLCVVMLVSMMTAMTVAADVSAIDLGDTPITVITAGGTTQLWINGQSSASLEGITYTSSNEEFVTVSSTGLVTGNKTGIATITATSGDASDTILIAVAQETAKASGFPSAFVDDSAIKRAGNNTKKFDLSSEKNLAYINYDVLDQGYNTFSFWYYVDGTYNKEMIFRFNKWTNQQEADKQKITYNGIAPADSSFVNANFDFDAWDSGYVGFMRQTVSTTTANGFTGQVKGSPFVIDKGWHQFVCRITEESLTIYCDGKVVFSGKGRQFLSPANLSVLKGKTTTAGSYNFADKQYYNTGDVEIDIAKGTSVAKRNITFNVGENGSVSYWKGVIADGTSLGFSDGYSLKLKVTPEAEYEIYSVVVGGEKLTPDADNCVTFDVTEDTASVDVTFKKIGEDTGDDEEETLTDIDFGDTPTTVVTAGGTAQLYINGEDASNISGITYTSSNEEFVTVNETGLVTGVKAGIATITATSGELSDTVLIAVSNTDVKTSKFPSAFVEDAEVKRAGSNTSKHGLTKDGTVAFINYDVLDMGYNTFSFWYYDDGTNNISLQFNKWTNQQEADKQNTTYNGIAPADTTFANAFRLRTRSDGYIGFASVYDNENWKGFSDAPHVYAYPSETGWHQLVFRITEESLNIYCDGKVIFSGSGRQFMSLANLETVALAYGEKAYNLSDKLYYNTGDVEIDVTGGTSVARRNITFNVGDNGTLYYWKDAIADGESLGFSDGYTLKIKATPAEGYQIDKIKVGDEEYTPDKDSCVSFVVAEDTANVDVTFKEEVKAPTIGRTEVINASSDYKGSPAAITYIKITDGKGIAVKESGILLGVGGVINALKAYAQYTDEANNTPVLSGEFAIKVFGEGVMGVECTSQPYITYVDGTEEKTAYGEVEHFTINDNN